MVLKNKEFYEFDCFRLDPSERILFRDGKLVPLTPKAFDTLLLLIENNGHILEKDEMLKKIWPDTFVEEANLAVNVSALRKALGEQKGKIQYIETIPRRGYRFNAEVKKYTDQPAETEGNELVAQKTAPVIAEEPFSVEVLKERKTVSIKTTVRPASEAVDESAAMGEGDKASKVMPSAVAQANIASPENLATRNLGEEAKHEGWTGVAQKSWLQRNKQLALALVALVFALAAIFVYFTFLKPAPPSRRLAIMPFVNLKGDSETDFLSLSLADVIITKLNYASEVSVLPTSYVSKYRNQWIDAKAVANELKVQTMLTGTYQREGDDITINTQLIDIKSDRTVWQESIRLKYNRVVEIQDKVAQQVIHGLQVQMSSDERERASRGSTQNSQAFELYLQGVDLYQTNNFKSALDNLEKSVKLDPQFALAWAHLGRAYSASAAFQLGGATDYQKAQAYYDRALELSPDQIEAHIFKANLLTDTGRAAEAVPLLRDVMKTNPNLAEAHWELGYAYRFGGMVQESITECETARRIDPEVKLYSSALNSYLYNGEYQKFMDSLPQRNIAFIVFYRGYANYYLGNLKAAVESLNQAYELNPDLYTRIGKAFSYAIEGKNKEGIELLRDTRQMIEERNVADAEGIYKVAQAYAVLGDKETALRMLRRSIEGGFFCYPYFTNDTLIKNLRNENEYKALMETARARHEEFKSRFF
jgi:DNA-binding winged helix-turn-helix (wHTH) protein/TolB-like protein/Flp pilus assembly protein TadD